MAVNFQWISGALNEWQQLRLYQKWFLINNLMNFVVHFIAYFVRNLFIYLFCAAFTTLSHDRIDSQMLNFLFRYEYWNRLNAQTEYTCTCTVKSPPLFRHILIAFIPRHFFSSSNIKSVVRRRRTEEIIRKANKIEYKYSSLKSNNNTFVERQIINRWFCGKWF